MRQIFDSIDSIMKEVDSARKEPEFAKEIEKRKQRTPNRIQNDNDVLRIFAELIAYSQNAPSDSVSAMLNKNIFNDVFHNFEINKVAEMDSNTILTHHWNKIKVIRFRKKINCIIGCAKSLASIKENHGSFMALLEKLDKYRNLKSEADVERFWEEFNHLKNELEKENMPFFKQPTSLLHFLLSIGYDCIKPDLVVMKVAKELGIVDSERGTQNLLQAVRVAQLYSVNRKIRPSIVDLYFLVYGGQRDAKQFVNALFYKGRKYVKSGDLLSSPKPRQRRG